MFPTCSGAADLPLGVVFVRVLLGLLGRHELLQNRDQHLLPERDHLQAHSECTYQSMFRRMFRSMFRSMFMFRSIWGVEYILAVIGTGGPVK